MSVFYFCILSTDFGQKELAVLISHFVRACPRKMNEWEALKSMIYSSNVIMSN